MLLILGANAGLIGMSKVNPAPWAVSQAVRPVLTALLCVHQEHLSVALALSLPIVCVITKVDSTPPQVYEQTVKQLVKVLRSPGCRKKPVFVSSFLSDLPSRNQKLFSFGV